MNIYMTFKYSYLSYTSNINIVKIIHVFMNVHIHVNMCFFHQIVKYSEHENI